MVRFSPLRDRQLPACQMIWLGGGYPELHAAGLSANHEMLTQLRAAHRRGVAIYAECGGLMYLGTTEVTSGERYTMADIIPGHSRMGTRLTRFGYCEAQARQQTLLAALASGCAAMNFITPIFLPPPPPYWPAVNSETVRRSSSGREDGSPAAPLPAISMSILPSVPPCSTTGCGQQGGRYDPSRLVCSLDT